MMIFSFFCSACGWDHVLQGLVMLGFNLMELYAPKSQCESLVLEDKSQSRNVTEEW